MQNTTVDSQARMALHGCIILMFGLLGGIGFSYAAAVAETSSQLYGVWKFVHMEGLVNGILVLAVAGVWHKIASPRLIVQIGRWTLLIGAYCNAIGPWLTALFVGHRVIQPQNLLESVIVFGFYVPGTLPMLSFALFIVALATARR